ncbi:MAG: MFS transporter [candidate division Zixibacteria bacterium]|nr:MFS transporter [candidate division Zixibacteria bacterium]
MATAPQSNAPGQPAAREGLIQTLTSMGRPYWMVNIMEMIERLAYYGVRVVIPIYIAQADEIGGLHFSQEQKGYIFLWWALFQSLTPMISGGFADRYGYKKTIAVSIGIKVLGYILMATQTSYYPFLFGCCVLALGTAIFKPGVQGTMCQALSKKNSSVGWGTFYMLVNIGGFLGPPVAHFLYGYGWPAVFYGCAAMVSLNFLMLLTYKDLPAGGEQTGSFLKRLGETIIKFFNVKLIVFVVIMSGFWLMFMQLFDMLPNFIVDWVDSSKMVAQLGLPDWMLQANSPRAPQLSQEWMINANAGLIIIAVIFVSWLVARMRRTHSITLGIIISSVGLVFAGFTTAGYLCMAGILVFSVGEMLSSPKMNEYLGVIAPPGEKGLYMGYANVPQGIGWGLGSVVAGHVYDNLGDKANLAIDYMAKNLGVSGIDRPEAMNKLVELTGMTHQEATNMLWDAYEPYRLWYRFAAIGIASAIAMLFYAKWVKKSEAPDV